MKAVVLAAGEGTRMWPLTSQKPKHLLPVGGKPLITHVLEALSKNSVSEVFMVVGFRGDAIRSALGGGTSWGLHLEYLNQPKRTGTASALKVAHESVGSEPFLAVYGDLWLGSSAIEAVLQKSRESPRVMGVVKVPNPWEYGLVELDGDRLGSIAEKPRKAARKDGWVNSGIYVLDGSVFQATEKTAVSKRAEYELTSSLQRLIAQGEEIKAAVIPAEGWMDVGRPWDLLEANERALNTLDHNVKGTVEQGAILKEPVWLEEGSVIRSGCYIEGPLYIGRDSRIGPNSRLRPATSIGDRVVVGTSCEIKNSIIMNGTKIPHLSYVGDSIIGEGCNLGAGTITANIRFDEEIVRMRVKGRLQSTGRKKLGVVMGDRVQTGINTSLLPGVRIGSKSWIGPGVILSKDVPEGQILIAKQAYLRRRKTSK